MAKLKESKATYSAEPITVVTARGHTEIPRVLRERYRVAPKSRLRWIDTGEGLLIVPLAQPRAPRRGKPRTHKMTNTRISPKNRDFLKWLDEWMNEPDN